MFIDSKITLIDIRYVPIDKIKEFVDPSRQDVLILYNALLMNAGYLQNNHDVPYNPFHQSEANANRRPALTEAAGLRLI